MDIAAIVLQLTEAITEAVIQENTEADDETIAELVIENLTGIVEYINDTYLTEQQ